MNWWQSVAKLLSWCKMLAMRYTTGQWKFLLVHCMVLNEKHYFKPSPPSRVRRIWYNPDCATSHCDLKWLACMFLLQGFLQFSVCTLKMKIYSWRWAIFVASLMFITLYQVTSCPWQHPGEFTICISRAGVICRGREGSKCQKGNIYLWSWFIYPVLSILTDSSTPGYHAEVTIFPIQQSEILLTGVQGCIIQ